MGNPNKKGWITAEHRFTIAPMVDAVLTNLEPDLPAEPGGLTIPRRFTREGTHPFDQVGWNRREALITGEGGDVVFSQKGVEAPESWSDLAVNVVASKYFRGHPGTPEREGSVRDLIGRVARTLGDWGRSSGIFAQRADADAFEAELTHLLLHQRYAFNSPVWFNVGVQSPPQCSACFINSVEDSMDSILELAKTEARLFKGGSGTGTNLSVLRASRERLSGGGTASGPVSFMRGYDAFAGVIKSGGKTRRAAKMVILDADHPDVEEFVWCKASEEKKAWALIDRGYDGSFNGEAYRSVFFQNANHSLRVTDAFMERAIDDRPWELRARTTGEAVATVSARKLLMDCAEAAHVCGDPGIQFDTTINAWNPCKVSGRINASNPCSEYMFLDDSACNLGSLNLLRFMDERGGFRTDDFRHAVRIATIAQELIVDNAGYPTDRIAVNSQRYRPLGLGYANLGALLMSRGHPYDSEDGRALAAALTALMCGEAYRTSAEVAGAIGPFAAYPDDAASFLDVVGRHRDRAHGIPEAPVPDDLLQAARDAWDRAHELGRAHGFRNAQATVLAPTGTIAFMMDCDTTGIEPDLALVKYKRLAGGGTLKLVNRSVPRALERLGYDAHQVQDILKYVEEEETIEGAPHLEDGHLPVFDCAFRPAKGMRSIAPEGHLRMMSAVQPFVSGAISKTINVPNDASAQDIFDVYVTAWRLGLKAVAVYRDGSKRTQPLSTQAAEQTGTGTRTGALRRRLEPERASLTHKFAVGGHEGYITVGLYPEGVPGEIFITMSKEGSTISGLMDTIATSISLALQYGVPLRVLVDRFSHMRFEPSGFTGNPNIPMAKSIVDYIFRWLGQKFSSDGDGPTDTTLSRRQEEAVQAALRAGVSGQMTLPMPDGGSTHSSPVPVRGISDGPPCPVCGSLTVRAGACDLCPNCGTTTGCG